MNNDEKSRELLEALSEYVRKCNEENAAKDKKERSVLPNVCGYCRYMNIGRDELFSILEGDRVTADRISTVLEDALINSGSSSGDHMHCMRLIEALRGEENEEEGDNGAGITVIFPHPDGEDT